MSKAQGKFDFSVHLSFDKNQKFQYWDFKVPSVRHTHTHTLGWAKKNRAGD